MLFLFSSGVNVDAAASLHKLLGDLFVGGASGVGGGSGLWTDTISSSSNAAVTFAVTALAGLVLVAAVICTSR